MPARPSTLAAAPSATRRVRALVESMRPAQWLKNAALLVAPTFAQRMTDPASLGPVATGVVSFCLLASATYLANDIADREQDRLHPDKHSRPIAAGVLPASVAGVSAAALCAAGLALAVAIGPGFALAAVAYLALQVAYTLVLKHVVIVDVFAIAAGFVLRVVAGAEAVVVPISNWLYLCTLLVSLLLALAKRRAELSLLGSDASRHRRILAEYSAPMLDQLITVLSSCTVVAYALYTVSPETLHKFGSDRLKFTVPFVLFGLMRYLYLIHRRGAGGQPERVLLLDRPTQVNLAAYLATVAWAIYR
jgi:4-hydroxybenzoate polyprenyltransferase